MPTVVVNKRSANVVVKAVNGVFQQATTSGVTLNNQGGTIIPRLDNLSDVVEGSPVDGAVLTYNAEDDKYYVLPPDFNNTSVDGGTF
jgi:hypothetical protein